MGQDSSAPLRASPRKAEEAWSHPKGGIAPGRGAANRTCRAPRWAQWRSRLDLEGNLLRQDVSRDASTTLTVLTQTFDILGRVCMARHPDSGAKLIWRDVASATLGSWDTPNTADERSQRFEYDELRRPVRRWVGTKGALPKR